MLIFSALFLSSNFIVSGIIAKEDIRYVKGLGAVLREQPSILSKKLTKLSRGTKVLALEAKGIWHVTPSLFCFQQVQDNEAPLQLHPC